MVISSSLVSVLLATATLFSVITATDSKSSVQGHRLKSYSEDGVEGCYIYNQTLGVCFDVKRGSLKIRKTTGEAIVHYQDLGPKEFFYQILEQAFVGEGPTMFYVPDYIPRETEPLRAFLKYIMSKKGVEQREALKTHFQQAMSELHYVPEVQLLERVSAALGGNSTRLEILKPFHALCFYLMKQCEVDVPVELKAASDMQDVTADQYDRGQRCTSLQGRYKSNCMGMCGKKCSCWRWVCAVFIRAVTNTTCAVSMTFSVHTALFQSALAAGGTRDTHDASPVFGHGTFSHGTRARSLQLIFT